MKKLVLLTSCALSLSACQQLTESFTRSGPSTQATSTRASTNWQSSDFSKKQMSDGAKLPFEFASAIPKDKVNSSTRALVAEGVLALDKGDLKTASKLFNTALRLDLGNSYLHFMNGLTYHLIAKGGNTRNYEFAEQGYELAFKFDETNSLAKYYLGLAYLDQRKFKEAQGALAAAAVMNDKDAEILYDLARASYFAGDPRTSQASLDKILSMPLDPAAEAKYIRASVLTNAALNHPSEARALLEHFKGDDKMYSFLDNRVASWEKLHEEEKSGKLLNANYQLAQVLPKKSNLPTIPGSAPALSKEKGATEDSSFVNSEMVVVDVVIIRTQEDVSSNRGLNLLSGLQLQFGDPLTNSAGISFGKTKIIDERGINPDSKTRTVSNLISIPAVNYSLNIFNTLDGRNEILASPSLVALANEKSEFFSGVDVVAAAVSGGDGSSISVNKKIGVKLGVTPEFLPNDYIKLEVEAERTFLTSPSSSVQFEFRLDTSNTNVNANVVMKFGETLILSGLSEKETESTRDAVPVLGDIPIIQYLFSNQAKRDFRKSVLIMMTPRRAQYVNQSKEGRAKLEGSLSEFEKTLSTFEQRNENWFTPPSTASEIIKITQVNSLVNEYKTGDFKLENWNSRSTHQKRLKKAVEFLFY